MFRPVLLGGTHPMPFKVKINVLLLLAILVVPSSLLFADVESDVAEIRAEFEKAEAEKLGVES